MPGPRQSAISTALLDDLIEEATVDCYNDSEQVTGLFSMIDEHLVLPFQATVLGQLVTVARVDVMTDDQIVALCTRDEHRQTIPIPDLPVPDPWPDGWEWVEAYRRWAP
jgi:Calcium binding